METKKVERSIDMIRATLGLRSAVLLSFGKDSMALAHLIRDALTRPALSAHDFPLPVIYHRDPWFPHKHEFAESVIKSWGMEVHDWAPLAAGVKVKDDMLELVARYPFNGAGMDLPKNVCSPEEYPRRDYICGLRDWLERPKSDVATYPFDTVFHGHKSSDVDPFEGNMPLKSPVVQVGTVRLVFPLSDWTDADVWDYIEAEHIPVQLTRYKERIELADKWLNNDYIHACTACIDPREKAKTVYCPKLRRQVPNVGARVLQLNEIPNYIGVVA